MFLSASLEAAGGDGEGVLRPGSDCFEREVDEGLEFIYLNS